MSFFCRDTNRLIEAAIEQLTPEMEHVCVLPSTTFVKITQIVNVVRSEMQVRADEGPRCPPGSKDLPRNSSGGDEPCEPKAPRARTRAKRAANPPAKPPAKKPPAKKTPAKKTPAKKTPKPTPTARPCKRRAGS